MSTPDKNIFNRLNSEYDLSYYMNKLPFNSSNDVTIAYSQQVIDSTINNIVQRLIENDKFILAVIQNKKINNSEDLGAPDVFNTATPLVDLSFDKKYWHNEINNSNAGLSAYHLEYEIPPKFDDIKLLNSDINFTTNIGKFVFIGTRDGLLITDNLDILNKTDTVGSISGSTNIPKCLVLLQGIDVTSVSSPVIPYKINDGIKKNRRTSGTGVNNIFHASKTNDIHDFSIIGTNEHGIFVIDIANLEKNYYNRNTGDSNDDIFINNHLFESELAGRRINDIKFLVNPQKNQAQVDDVTLITTSQDFKKITHLTNTAALNSPLTEVALYHIPITYADIPEIYSEYSYINNGYEITTTDEDVIDAGSRTSKKYTRQKINDTIYTYPIVFATAENGLFKQKYVYTFDKLDLISQYFFDKQITIFDFYIDLPVIFIATSVGVFECWYKITTGDTYQFVLNQTPIIDDITTSNINKRFHKVDNTLLYINNNTLYYIIYNTATYQIDKISKPHNIPIPEIASSGFNNELDEGVFFPTPDNYISVFKEQNTKFFQLVISPATVSVYENDPTTVYLISASVPLENLLLDNLIYTNIQLTIASIPADFSNQLNYSNFFNANTNTVSFNIVNIRDAVINTHNNQLKDCTLFDVLINNTEYTITTEAKAISADSEDISNTKYQITTDISDLYNTALNIPDAGSGAITIDESVHYLDNIVYSYRKNITANTVYICYKKLFDVSSAESGEPAEFPKNQICYLENVDVSNVDTHLFVVETTDAPFVCYYSNNKIFFKLWQEDSGEANNNKNIICAEIPNNIINDNSLAGCRVKVFTTTKLPGKCILLYYNGNYVKHLIVLDLSTLNDRVATSNSDPDNSEPDNIFNICFKYDEIFSFNTNDINDSTSKIVDVVDVETNTEFNYFIFIYKNQYNELKQLNSLAITSGLVIQDRQMIASGSDLNNSLIANVFDRILNINGVSADTLSNYNDCLTYFANNITIVDVDGIDVDDVDGIDVDDNNNNIVCSPYYFVISNNATLILPNNTELSGISGVQLLCDYYQTQEEVFEYELLDLHIAGSNSNIKSVISNCGKPGIIYTENAKLKYANIKKLVPQTNNGEVSSYAVEIDYSESVTIGENLNITSPSDIKEYKIANNIDFDSMYSLFNIADKNYMFTANYNNNFNTDGISASTIDTKIAKSPTLFKNLIKTISGDESFLSSSYAYTLSAVDGNTTISCTYRELSSLANNSNGTLIEDIINDENLIYFDNKIFPINRDTNYINIETTYNDIFPHYVNYTIDYKALSGDNDDIILSSNGAAGTAELSAKYHFTPLSTFNLYEQVVNTNLLKTSDDVDNIKIDNIFNVVNPDNDTEYIDCVVYTDSTVSTTYITALENSGEINSGEITNRYHFKLQTQLDECTLIEVPGLSGSGNSEELSSFFDRLVFICKPAAENGVKTFRYSALPKTANTTSVIDSDVILSSDLTNHICYLNNNPDILAVVLPNTITIAKDANNNISIALQQNASESEKIRTLSNGFTLSNISQNISFKLKDNVNLGTGNSRAFTIISTIASRDDDIYVLAKDNSNKYFIFVLKQDEQAGIGNYVVNVYSLAAHLNNDDTISADDILSLSIFDITPDIVILNVKSDNYKKSYPIDITSLLTDTTNYKLVDINENNIISDTNNTTSSGFFYIDNVLEMDGYKNIIIKNDNIVYFNFDEISSSQYNDLCALLQHNITTTNITCRELSGFENCVFADNYVINFSPTNCNVFYTTTKKFLNFIKNGNNAQSQITYATFNPSENIENVLYYLNNLFDANINLQQLQYKNHTLFENNTIQVIYYNNIINHNISIIYSIDNTSDNNIFNILDITIIDDNITENKLDYITTKDITVSTSGISLSGVDQTSLRFPTLISIYDIINNTITEYNLIFINKCLYTYVFNTDYHTLQPLYEVYDFSDRTNIAFLSDSAYNKKNYIINDKYFINNNNNNNKIFVVDFKNFNTIKVEEFLNVQSILHVSFNKTSNSSLDFYFIGQDRKNYHINLIDTSGQFEKQFVDFCSLNTYVNIPAERKILKTIYNKYYNTYYYLTADNEICDYNGNNIFDKYFEKKQSVIGGRRITKTLPFKLHSNVTTNNSSVSSHIFKHLSTHLINSSVEFCSNSILVISTLEPEKISDDDDKNYNFISRIYLYNLTTGDLNKIDSTPSNVLFDISNNIFNTYSTNDIIISNKSLGLAEIPHRSINCPTNENDMLVEVNINQLIVNENNKKILNSYNNVLTDFNLKINASKKLANVVERINNLRVENPELPSNNVLLTYLYNTGKIYFEVYGTYSDNNNLPRGCISVEKTGKDLPHYTYAKDISNCSTATNVSTNTTPVQYKIELQVNVSDIFDDEHAFNAAVNSANPSNGTVLNLNVQAISDIFKNNIVTIDSLILTKITFNNSPLTSFADILTPTIIKVIDDWVYVSLQTNLFIRFKLGDLSLIFVNDVRDNKLDTMQYLLDKFSGKNTFTIKSVNSRYDDFLIGYDDGYYYSHSGIVHTKLSLLDKTDNKLFNFSAEELLKIHNDMLDSYQRYIIKNNINQAQYTGYYAAAHFNPQGGSNVNAIDADTQLNWLLTYSLYTILNDNVDSLYDVNTDANRNNNIQIYIQHLSTIKDSTTGDIFVLISTNHGVIRLRHRLMLINEIANETLDVSNFYSNKYDKYLQQDTFNRELAAHISSYHKNIPDNLIAIDAECSNFPTNISEEHDNSIVNDIVERVEFEDAATKYIKGSISNWAMLSSPKHIVPNSRYSPKYFYDYVVDVNDGIKMDYENLPYIAKIWQSGIVEFDIFVPTTETYYIDMPVNNNTNTYEIKQSASRIRKNINSISGIINIPSLIATKFKLYINNAHFNLGTILDVQISGNSLPLKIYKDNVIGKPELNGIYNSVILPSVVGTFNSSSPITNNSDTEWIEFNFVIYGTDSQSIKILAKQNSAT